MRDLNLKQQEAVQTIEGPLLVLAGAGARLRDWPWYVHGALGLGTLLVNVWAYRVELRHLAENSRVLDAVMNEVAHIRLRHGLPSSAEALAEGLGRPG